MKNPRVLVGGPTSDYKGYCLKEYIKAIKSLTYSNYDILLVDNSKDNNHFNKIKQLKVPVIKDKFTEKARDRIVSSRNKVREHVLKNNYDYFLSLEQDVIPPKDVIERLLKHKKQVVSGIYFTMNDFNGVTKIVPLIYERDPSEEELFLREIDSSLVWNDKLMKIAACGMGCVLMHKNVLKKIKFRYDKKLKAFDDMFFAKDCKENKINIFVDTSIKCKHLVKNWTWTGIEI